MKRASISDFFVGQCKYLVEKLSEMPSFRPIIIVAYRLPGKKDQCLA